MKRILGRYKGEKKGPMLLCIGGIHGNEFAGIHAIENVIKMLEVEPFTNPSFDFRGIFIGMSGNQQALKVKERFLSQDMNRMFTKENIDFVKNSDYEDLQEEFLEMKLFMEAVQREITDYQPEKLYVLDLHTTSSYGGIFTIVTEDPESLRVGLSFHAPVITDMTKGLQGTLLHYFTKDNVGVDTTVLTFESGQHEEVLSINRAIAATINFLKAISCVEPEDVENIHNKILVENSKGLPKVAQFIERYSIQDSDKFKMNPSYKNFQHITKGEVLAMDKDGKICADKDAMILMPLYQNKGKDGFFIVKEVKGY